MAITRVKPGAELQLVKRGTWRAIYRDAKTGELIILPVHFFVREGNRFIPAIAGQDILDHLIESHAPEATRRYFQSFPYDSFHPDGLLGAIKSEEIPSDAHAVLWEDVVPS